MVTIFLGHNSPSKSPTPLHRVVVILKMVCSLSHEKCIIPGEIEENDIQKSYKTCAHTPYIKLNSTYLHGSIYGCDGAAIMAY